jgi:tight adherence protein B
VLLAVALGIAVATAPSASGQEPGPALEVARPDVSNAPDLRAAVTLPPELTGGRVPAEAFAVFEDGERRAVTVERLRGAELEVVLMLDTSGSMAGPPLRAAQDAAVGFVQKAPAGTRIAVVGFGHKPYVASSFTTNGAALERAIRSLTPTSGTTLHDGVALASGLFARRTEAQRSIVLLADGDDTASKTGLATVTDRLETRNIQLDAVGFSTVSFDSLTLQRLAEAGGGRVLTASNAGALAAVYDDLASSLAHRYSLRWRSEAAGRTTLRFRVAVNNVIAEREERIDLPATSPAKTSLFASGWVLAAGAACLFLALFVGGRQALASSRTRRAFPLTVGAVAAAPSALSRAEQRASALADQALDRWGKRLSLNTALERAGVVLRPGEFLVLVGTVGMGAFLVASLLGGPLVGILAIAVTAMVCRLVLTFRTDRRRARFADQLGDTLQLLAGSLRAGYGLLQAIDAVAQEADEPTRQEFRRIVIETRLGRDLTEALLSMADRVGGEDFRWVVQAIEIHRDVGGDLAQVLDTVAGTIRERNQLRRQVAALSAEGRMSANVLVVIPVFLLVVIRATNPEYLAELGQGGGLLLAMGGAASLVVGVIWLRRMCRLVY